MENTGNIAFDIMSYSAVTVLLAIHNLKRLAGNLLSSLHTYSTPGIIYT